MEAPGIVDTRQPPNVIEALVLRGWQADKLNAGDFRWRYAVREPTLTFGIEYKAQDLVTSLLRHLKSGVSELRDELMRLKAEVDIPILLFEEIPKATWDRYLLTPMGPINVKWDAIAAFIRSIQNEGIRLDWGVPNQQLHNVLACKAWYDKEFHAGLTPT